MVYCDPLFRQKGMECKAPAFSAHALALFGRDVRAIPR